jgi:hypothetical protein
MKIEPQHAVAGRVVSLLLMATASVWLAGCLVFPTNHYEAGSRHDIPSLTQTNLQIGVTTKEDVLLMLGEPDIVATNEQCFVYRSAKVKAVWVAYAVVAPIGLGGGDFEHVHELEVLFDASNRVAQARFSKHWRNKTD